MPWVAGADLLRRDRQILGHEDRGQKVLVEFQRPILEPLTSEFYRIHLSEVQMDGSEATFYRADVFQPHRVGVRPCPCCGGPLVPHSVEASWCRNPACRLPSGEPTRGKLFVTGPVRGVIRVQTPRRWVVERTEREVQSDAFRRACVPVVMVRGVELVLDRRYPDPALCAVKRAAGGLCDLYGWGML